MIIFYFWVIRFYCNSFRLRRLMHIYAHSGKGQVIYFYCHRQPVEHSLASFCCNIAIFSRKISPFTWYLACMHIVMRGREEKWQEIMSTWFNANNSVTLTQSLIIWLLNGIQTIPTKCATLSMNHNSFSKENVHAKIIKVRTLLCDGINADVTRSAWYDVGNDIDCPRKTPRFSFIILLLYKISMH